MRVVVTWALAALALMYAVASPAQAWDAFTVEEIEVRGAERISVGTVLNYLPVLSGETFGPSDAPRAIRALYDTGLFQDVELAREDGSLVVRVEERPAIAEINLEGDFTMDEEQLRQSLSEIGLDRGRTFNRSLLERVERELKRQLFSRGKYGMEFETEVRDLERNRVAIDITIREGKTARIRQVKVLGNETFDDDTLKDLMESGIPSRLALFSSADEYSRAKLEGDIEAIRSHYLDRGFAEFAIASSQVTITPDKKDIYLTIVVDEGERYRIGDIELDGEFPVDREELRAQIQASSGDVFSRRALTESRNAIADRLAQDGYSFARINVVPQVNESEQRVDVRFFVEPGQRVYVRRITFSGHRSTDDNVYRREMRQLEGARYSPNLVDRSQVRLQRLPQVQDARTETNRVAGTDDQVDLNYALTERRTGSLSLSAGVSSTEGLIFSGSVRQQNLFGSGRDLMFRIDTSESNRQFVVSYTNPYHTDWGVSRTLQVRYRESDPDDILDTADYYSDSASVGVDYGIPISEYSRLNAGIALEGTRIQTTDSTPDQINDFIDVHGAQYGFLEGSLAWTHDTRNRTIFAETGALNRISLDATLPSSDLEFYKLNYRFEGYMPVTDRVVASLSGDIGYGDGYGEQDDLPFFRHYYAGGIRSVRGYKGASLGPRYGDSDDATGGDFRTVGTFELTFPPPMAPESGQTRLSLFYDFGNVFADVGDYETGELRSSAGISFNWRSPIGPLSFSFAEPINPEPEDETETFQFTIGTLF
ncbi:MAG: outer membrane protein assembly factor BamA [Halofilum sp. (in: g-proteobacteria)]